MPPLPQRHAAPPRWLVILASIPIVYHLASVTLCALAAPSGPWPSNEGMSMAMPPPAAQYAHEQIGLTYLRTVKLTHNYHFISNRGGMPDAYLEIRLENEAGELVKSVRLPDPEAPALVRKRQALLVRWLTDDQPVMPPASEKIYAPGTEPPRLPIWDFSEERRLIMREVSELEIPRNRGPVFRPTDWSLIIVRSLARHYCRQHGAAQAQVIRHSREATPPSILLQPQTQRLEVPETLVSDYGRIAR